MKQLLAGIGFTIVGLTLLPLFRSERWWIRIWDFPRLQLAIGLGAVLLCYAALCTYSAPDWFLCGVMCGCIVYHIVHIAAYTPVVRVQTLAATRGMEHTHFSMLISNVKMDNRNAAGFLDVVRQANADIVLANEPDSWWEGQLHELDEYYPYQKKIPQDNTYGMILYSRLVCHQIQEYHLVDADIPSIRALVEIPSGDVVELFAVHPRPPLPSSDTGERDAELLIVGRMVRASKEPSIVLGDMNDVAWSYTTRLFQKISGLLDPRVGRGLFNTFNALFPFMRWPLDHIFHSPSFRLVELRRLGNFGSDHFSILVQFSYEPEIREQQTLPPPLYAEKRYASHLIRHVLNRRDNS